MDFKIKNFTMETFNNDVNHSGDLNKKYVRCADYRRKINDFMLTSIKDKSHDSIFVFGAGSCNDIDLKFLLNVFNSVTISDIDAVSMAEGMNRQKLSDVEKEKITMVKIDYLGLDNIKFFHNISDLVNERKTEKDISEYIQNAISKHSNKAVLSSYKNKYSVVLVLPTYTQLAYTQMEALLRILYQYNIYEVDDLNKMITSMYHSMPKILSNYNDLVLSLVGDDGVIVTLIDTLEINDKQILKKLKEQIDNKEQIRNYLKKEYSDLAQIGLADLKNKIHIFHEAYTIWPFDENKEYVVNMLAGCK